MPKKTAYSRSAAQRNKAKPKSFELVRSASEDEELVSGQAREKTRLAKTTSEEERDDEPAGEDTEQEEEEEEEEIVEKVTPKTVPNVTRVEPVKNQPAKVAEVTTTGPKSASARLAERRKAGQKARAQRSPTNLILAENYTYVRKELLFILILAIIMFAAIITMHFVPAIGG